MACAAPGAFAQGASSLDDPRIISPAGLGPQYSGYSGAGIGLQSIKPQFGFKAGDFVIQPRFFLEGAFTSNFFRADTRNLTTNNVAVTEEPVFSFHLKPGIAIFNPDYSWAAFSLGVDADVRLPVSTKKRVSRETNVGVTAAVSAVLFPKSLLSFRIDERFDRQLWVRPESTNDNANRNHNSLGGDLSFHPGGRALDFTLGYRWDLVRYDDLDDLDTDGHHFRFLATWRFYPQNYVFLESTFKIHQHRVALTAAEQVPGYYSDGMPLKIYAGVSGLLTEWLALTARAGYGNSFLARGGDFSSFIGMLQSTFRFTPTTVLHVGVARDFEMAALGGYFDFVRAYLSFEQGISDIVLIHADFSFDYRWFGAFSPLPVTVVQNGAATTIPVGSNDITREDPVLRAGLLADFNISRIFGVSVGYRFDGNFTGYQLTTNPGGGGGASATEFTGYQEHRVYATFNLRY